MTTYRWDIGWTGIEEGAAQPSTLCGSCCSWRTFCLRVQERPADEMKAGRAPNPVFTGASGCTVSKDQLPFALAHSLIHLQRGMHLQARVNSATLQRPKNPCGKGCVRLFSIVCRNSDRDLEAGEAGEKPRHHEMRSWLMVRLTLVPRMFLSRLCWICFDAVYRSDFR